MAAARAFARSIAVAALTGSVLLLWLVAGTVTLPWLRIRIRCRNFCFRHWARLLLRIVGCRVAVEGKAPQAPFFLVANHLSYIDILVLASQVDAVFIAKSEVSAWPVMGFLCRSIGTLFVDRTLRRDLPRVGGEIECILDRGQGLVLFPEGTSTAGLGVDPFRPSLLEAAARAELPVSYASLSYRTTNPSYPTGKTVCWWGEMTFPGHFLGLLGSPGFRAQLTFGSETLQNKDRKVLARLLHQAVLQQFVPVVDQ